MTDKTENLWGINFKPPDIRTPKHILEEQAGLLEKLTNSVLRGLVNTDRPSLMQPDFKHDFEIYAHGLRGYTYTLFTVQQPVEMYPLTIQSEVFDIGERVCKNESEFRAALREILSHKSTKRVIDALIAQSR